MFSSLWQNIRGLFFGGKMEYIVYFVLTFIFCYLISYFLLVRKNKKYDKTKVPIEIEYMIKKYNFDIKTVNYSKLLNSISLVSSLDMSIAVIIVYNIKNIFLQLIVGFVVLIPLILVSFKLLTNYYTKKGYVKDERKLKKNRK